MSIVDNNRPPYVAFEVRAVEDRTKLLSEGHYGTKDVDFAIITRPGDRDTVEKPALEWLKELAVKAKQEMIPQTWVVAFNAAYKAWKEGEELPVDGVPIKGWPILSPSAQKDILAAGIRTVEDLAAAPESTLALIGTGALTFKQKAAAWLLAANDFGKVTEQMVSQATQIEQLTNLVREQAEALKQYKAAESLLKG